LSHKLSLSESPLICVQFYLLCVFAASARDDLFILSILSIDSPGHQQDGLKKIFWIKKNNQWRSCWRVFRPLEGLFVALIFILKDTEGRQKGYTVKNGKGEISLN